MDSDEIHSKVMAFFDSDVDLPSSDVKLVKNLTLITRSVAGWGCKVLLLDNTGPDFDGMVLVTHKNKLVRTNFSGCINS